MPVTDRQLAAYYVQQIADELRQLVEHGEKCLNPQLCQPSRTLLFEQGAQYKISKTKLSISMIAVTPATESTKASLASW
jgi:hypothetical protein